MKSPFYFLIKPHKGDKYRTTMDIDGLDIIVNDNIDNHEHTNRVAEVVETPQDYKGIIEKGDLIVVHHNTFRVGRTQMGEMNNGIKHIFDDLYFTQDPYMVIKNGEMISIDPYLFLERVPNNDEFSHKHLNENVGIVAVNSYKQENELGLKKGDTIVYEDYRNYYFNVLGKEFIKIDTRDVCAKV